MWRTDPLLQTPHILVPIIEGIPTMPRTAVTANSLVVTHHAASSMIVDLFDDPLPPRGCMWIEEAARRLVYRELFKPCSQSDALSKRKRGGCV